MQFRFPMASLVATLLVASTVNGYAQVVAQSQIYVESFDGPLTTVMLNGAIRFGASGPWSTRVANGALELENRTVDNSMRIIKIERVIHPGSLMPMVTDDATIEATLRVSGEERSGAGVVARYESKTNDYYVFAVGPLGTFHVIQHKSGKARQLTTGTNEAIRAGGTNRVLVRIVGRVAVFEVNGREIVRMPGDDMPGGFVGVSAFGRGTFAFDEVRLAPPGVDMTPAR
jgi:hypothetical protein